MSATPAALALAVLAISCTLVAQCGTVAIPSFGHQGPDGPPEAVCWWDPDGTGPSAARLFVGGAFRFVGSTPCAGAAIFDPSQRTWQLLPAGMFDHVRAATVDGQGNLVVGGSRVVGSAVQHRVARWNGSTWTMLGGLFDAPVLSLAGFGSVDVLAGGEFTQNGATSLSRVANWNGTAWVSLGSGISGGLSPQVDAICLHPSGDVIVGGTFALAGGQPAANIARWNGANWQALGAGRPPQVISLAALANGDLFAVSLGQSLPELWNGVSWSSVPGLQPPFVGFGGTWIGALASRVSFQGDELLVVGNFRIGSQDRHAAVLTNFGFGYAYNATDIGLEGPAFVAPSRFRMAVDAVTGRVALAGPMIRANGVDVSGSAAFSGFEVDPLGDGLGSAGMVMASATLPNGDLVIGGMFQSIGKDAVPLVARSANGEDWVAPKIGAWPAVGGVDVRAFSAAPDGSLLVAGAMTLTGNTGADVLRYDGVNWSGFGPSPFLGYGANAVLQGANGTIYAGGLGFLRWSGTSWTLLSTVPSGVTATCFALAELPNGDIAVGGDLQSIPGGARPGIMRWNGTSWSPFGAGLASVVAASNPIVNAIEVRSDGVMFVVGMASAQTPFVARFDGTSWQALPAPAAGVLSAAELLPTGELVVGGEFPAIGGVAANSLARWNGTAWQAIGSGVTTIAGAPGSVLSLHFSPRGELHVGGNFQRHDGQVSLNFARVRSLCPALVQSFGSGCSSSNGPMALRDRTGAWLGSVARSVATGVPIGGLAIDVLGAAPAFVPLPLAPVGCTLWASPDVLGLVLPTNGSAELALAIPSSTSLLGQVYYQQVVGVELVGGAVGGFAATNRLQRTIGVF